MKDKKRLRWYRRFYIVPRQAPQDIEKVCDNIGNTIGISSFKHVKYETLDRGDKDKVEQEFLDMIINFKYTL